MGRIRRWLFATELEPDKNDDGLVFTDVLFGFVLAELFTAKPPDTLHHSLHLVLSVVIVLGSWIGFRRSRNRRRYQLKFFNLALWRFMLDQAMVYFYFRLATLRTNEPGIGAESLLESSLCFVSLAFALYLVWDILGMAMPANDDKPAPDQRRDWPGLWITAVHLVLFACLTAWVRIVTLDDSEANIAFCAAVLLALSYRRAKEVKYLPAHS